MSFSESTALTVAALRNYYLPLSYNTRGALRRLLLRYRLLESQPIPAQVKTQTALAAVDRLARLHTLVENLLQVYELLAEKLDASDHRKIRSLLGRAGQRKPGALNQFQRHIWVYTFIQEFDDALFIRRGLDPQLSRKQLDHLAQRSIARLNEIDARLRAFHSKYKQICAAFKHGRAVFGLEVTFTPDAADGGKLDMRPTDRLATAIREERDGRVTCYSLSNDVELESDIVEVAELVGDQVVKLLDMFERTATVVEQALDYHEGRRTDARLDPYSFYFFADPYTDEEMRLLRALS